MRCRRTYCSARQPIGEACSAKFMAQVGSREGPGQAIWRAPKHNIKWLVLATLHRTINLIVFAYGHQRKCGCAERRPALVPANRPRPCQRLRQRSRNRSCSAANGSARHHAGRGTSRLAVWNMRGGTAAGVWQRLAGRAGRQRHWPRDRGRGCSNGAARIGGGYRLACQRRSRQCRGKGKEKRR